MLPLLLCLKEKWKNREEKEGGIRYKDEFPPSRLRRFSPNESVTDGDDFKCLSKREDFILMLPRLIRKGSLTEEA